MLTDVIEVRPLADYKLNLRFENGEQRLFDMRPLLQIRPWNRIASQTVFECVRIAYGTVVWPGDIDVAPETLYDDSIPINDSMQ